MWSMPWRQHNRTIGQMVPFSSRQDNLLLPKVSPRPHASVSLLSQLLPLWFSTVRWGPRLLVSSPRVAIPTRHFWHLLTPVYGLRQPLSSVGRLLYSIPFSIYCFGAKRWGFHFIFFPTLSTLDPIVPCYIWFKICEHWDNTSFELSPRWLRPIWPP